MDFFNFKISNFSIYNWLLTGKFSWVFSFLLHFNIFSLIMVLKNYLFSSQWTASCKIIIFRKCFQDYVNCSALNNFTLHVIFHVKWSLGKKRSMYSHFNLCLWKDIYSFYSCFFFFTLFQLSIIQTKEPSLFI